jgi:PhnB protein
MSGKTADLTNEEVAVHAVIGAWAEALRKKNAEAVFAHYAADLVHFSLAPPLVSPESQAGELNAWFASWDGPIGYELHDVKVTAGADIAFSTSLNRMTGTMTDGEKSDIWFRHTLGFRKTGGVWKIAHEHESVPFYMDGSYKAAIDLTP